jgi:hypothetical protein
LKEKKIFLKKCELAGALEGTKNAMWVCATHYDFYAMCVQVQAKKSAH